MACRIAVPIMGKTIAEAKRQVAEAGKAADLIELRLDLIGGLLKKPGAVRMLVKACSKPVICTCRPLAEGGAFKGSEVERAVFLGRAVVAGADFADVEFSSSSFFRKSILSLAKEHGAKIILSRHFLKGTPAKKSLARLFSKMSSLRPFAIKIVCTSNGEKDNKTILDFVARHKNCKGKPKLIAFCMGRKGTASRVECAKAGAFLTFASLAAGRESSRGQIPVEGLRKLLHS
ncbi:3-dehydroquinate dehydratase [uncultured archaeon]|nr:3-dehydroquinate dehydratase [uncultured archaeon]